MTAQEIINKGQQIKTPHTIFEMDNLIWVIFSALALFAIAGTIVGKIVEKRTKSKYSGQMAVFLMMMVTAVIIIGFAATSVHINTDYQKAVAEWRSAYAYPYIRTKQYIDRELVSIENTFNDNPTVKYQNDDLITDTLRISYELSYDVPSGKKPYVRFYELKEDLGHGVTPDEYGLNVHLNKKDE